MTLSFKNQNDILNLEKLNSNDIEYIFSDKPINRLKTKPQIEEKIKLLDKLRSEIENIDNCEYLIMTAAVSDFTTKKENGKISRDSGNIQLNLTPNIDLVKTIKDTNEDIVTVAFSAQINDDLNFDKIKSKNCDYLVINNILKNNFGSDLNKIKIINKKELIYESNEKSKSDIAYELLDVLL